MKTYNRIINNILVWTLCTIAFPSCVTESSFDESVSRIDANEKQIATVNEQISSMSGSITSLEAVDVQLKGYIELLTSKASELQEEIDANAIAIEAAQQEEKEALLALEAELNAKLNAINLALADLKAKDAELESKISTLKEYVEKELKSAKDWATATFSTIEQYNSTVTIIAGIKADIESVNQALKDLEAKLSNKIDTSIAHLEDSLKKWVNAQLSAYYTIAQMDAKLAVIEKSVADGDKALMEEINTLKTKLSEQKSEITEAYKKAISEAIATNNGVIEGKIQDAVTEINGRITEEIASINQKIVQINNRLKGIEDQIATIDEQIKAINSSITQLKSTDAQLKEYIKSLQTMAASLQESIDANAKEIESVETRLSEAIDAAKLEQLEALKALEEELKGKLAAINKTISDLQAKDSELESKIAGLKEYVDKELKDAKDWASATFSTIEQYNSTVTIIAGIKADIESINQTISNLETSLNKKISEAIETLENSLKNWVNTQLTAYYTIAQIDAKVALIEKKIEDGDDEIKGEISTLRAQLSEQKSEITEAYKKAISDAITSNNGVIDGKIQTAVDEVNGRITSEVESINQQITGINNRLNGIEASIAEILGMIQSIVVVPSYSDGDVALGEDETTFYFEVLPLDAAKKLESVELTAFSLKAVSTIQTKANVEYKALPVKAIKFEDDLVKITTSGKEVSQDFFNGALSLNARLSITDGLNSLSSSYFGLKPQGDVNITNLRIAEYKKKVIDRIMTMGGAGNIIIRFVDGSSIELNQHSFAPRLYLDYDGYWSASYDNGENVSRIVDSEDDYVKVDNLQSESIISARFVEGSNGRYKLQIFNSSDPSVSLDEVNSLQSIDSNNSVLSIVEDNVNHTVTITVKNGLSFTYKRARIVPAGISVLTNKVYQAEGRTVAVEFRVNPSNASFNYDVSSTECEISLDYVGNATKSSYVTSPTNYKLSGVEQVYDSYGAKKEGQYKAYITDLGVSTTYDELAALVLTINDGLGQTVQLSSSATEIKYSGNLITEFKFLKGDNVNVSKDISAVILDNNIIINTTSILSRNQLIASFKSNGVKVFVDDIEQTSGITINDYSTPLKYTVVSVDGEKNVYNVIVNSSAIPLVCINTPNGEEVTSKEVYIGNTSISVVSVDNSDSFNAVGKIKGRGNNTWTKPKKPYAIKFDKKKSLLSLPEDKSWVLLANYNDPSLLRNDLALYLGNGISTLEWTPHFQFVDYVLNGQYKGIYQLGEKYKIAKTRVNVGDNGVLMEIDWRCIWEEDARFFYVDHIGSAINIKDPEVEYNDDIYNYAKAYVEAADAALYSENFTDTEEGWQHYMDMDSFVEWYIINEISRNPDGKFGSSCYMNLKQGGKLKMGPIWDFDLAFGNYGQSIYDNPEGFYIKDATWYTRLFEDPAFVAKVKERFNVYYANKQTILNHIDAQAAILKNKIYEDNKLWGTMTSTSASIEEAMTAYQEHVDNLKNWLIARLDWLNTNFNSL